MKRIIDIYWNPLTTMPTGRQALRVTKEQKLKYISILKLRDTETKEVNYIELQNYKFNFKLSETKYCIGYPSPQPSPKGGGSYWDFHECPINSKMESSTYTQCPYCEKIQGFKSAFLFGGEPNEEMREHLSQPHFIYLAYFEPGIIKVGTAAQSRKFLRPIEQDALIYCYIAQSDGFSIQRLEREISRQLGITETVRSSHKFKFLGAKINQEKARKILEEKYNQVYSQFSKHLEFKNWLFEKDQIEIIDISNNQEIFYPDKDVHLQKNELYVAGDFKGLRGRYLIIESDEEYIAFDVRTLIGRDIEEYIDDWRYNILPDKQLGFSF